MGSCEESFYDDPAFDLDSFMEQREFLSDNNNDGSKNIRDEELDKDTVRANSATGLKCQDRAPKKKLSLEQHRIEKCMYKFMEACNARGFVYGMISEDGKPISGASPNLRVWWKEHIHFDRRAPAVIEKYKKENAILKEDVNQRARASGLPTLHDFRDATIALILSALLKKCNPPQRNYPFEKGVPPPWWPTGKEEWLPQLGLTAEGPPPYRRPHDLKKDSKMTVLMAVIRHLCPDVPRIKRLILQSKSLQDKLSAKDNKTWLAILHQEEERLKKMDPGMFSLPPSSGSRNLVIHGTSNSESGGAIKQPNNETGAATLPNHQLFHMAESAERDRREKIVSAHQITGELNKTKSDLIHTRKQPSNKPQKIPNTSQRITPLVNQGQHFTQHRAQFEQAPYNIQSSQSVTPVPYNCPQGGPLVNHTSYNKHPISQEMSWTSYSVQTPIQQVNQNGHGFSEFVTTHNSDYLNNLYDNSEMNIGLSSYNNTIVSPNQQQHQHHQQQQQLQVNESFRDHEAPMSGNTFKTQYDRSSDFDSLLGIIDPHIDLPELNPCSSSNVASDYHALDSGLSQNALSWFYNGT